MKRFYCTVCKHIKRVRKMPRLVETPEAELPTNRVGECNWHADGFRTVRRALAEKKIQPVIKVVSTSKKRKAS